MIPIFKDGQRLLYFNELSEQAKIKAMREILDDDQYYLMSQYENAKNGIKSNINQCVNDKLFIERIRSRAKHFRSIQNDTKKLVSYIEANLAMFKNDGTYFRFYNR